MGQQNGWPVVETLAAFAIVFLLQWITAFAGVVGGLFVLSTPITENPWTIITSVYAHSGPEHLLSNSVALVLFGWPVARATTRLRFHLFFILTGAVAGLSQVLVRDALAGAPIIQTTGSVGVLGASGAVFALLGYLLASNRLSGTISELFSVPRWLTYLIFIGIAGVLTLATAQPGVALIAHFTGLLVGLLAGRLNLLAPPVEVTTTRR